MAVANGRQQADTGTKMIHLGRNTRSTIISKGISAGHGNNSYRGLVKVLPKADGARNVRCACLALVGHLVPCRLIHGNGENHLAAAHEGVHLVEQRTPRPQHPDARGAQHFVP